MPRNRVPNQRTITVNKAPTDKQNKYTANNLEALDEAAFRLQSMGGFKLYMYLSKNQNNYKFNLYSSDFMRWSGLKNRAYTTAFNELVEEGYLVLKEGTDTVYTFYDKSQKEEEVIVIEIPKEKVEEIKKAEESFIF